MLMLVSIFGLLSGLWLFSSFREHLLTSLLSLEFMALMVFSLFFIILNFYGLYYSLIYLVMAACEGALGLSILVRMGRTHGGDYFKSINLFIN